MIVSGSESVAAAAERRLHVVMYHYVRDVAGTRFPRLHAAPVDEFRRQVGRLAGMFEMATLESALAFLKGEFHPSRDLCLLTFDDGLREHYSQVMPVLVEARVQGVFFVITSAFERTVASVHKNHFVKAMLSDEEYEHTVLARAEEHAPDCSLDVDPAAVARIYRWDPPNIGRVKYLLNFQLPELARDRLVDDLFAEHIGDEAGFADELYLNWGEARDMQRHGMIIGGHSHSHIALGQADEARQWADVAACAERLHANLDPQPLWPFSYPYGKPGAYSPATVDVVRALNFSSAFSTTIGANSAGHDPYAINRVDLKDMPR